MRHRAKETGAHAEKDRLGISAAEALSNPYAAYYNPVVAAPQAHVIDALNVGPQANALFPPISDAPKLLNPGYWEIETGYTRSTDRGIRVHCLTKMPRVMPEMWDWWFGWHGCEARRYKLWHPQAHIDASWADGGMTRSQYMGRTSKVTEFIGPKCEKANISFVRPRVLGLDEARLARQGEVAICARIGQPHAPVQAGWLIHQLRPVEGGCEMRSRFWLGGEAIGRGNRIGPVQKALMRPLRPIVAHVLPDPRDLLNHCAQEMQHLSKFLPEIWAEFGPKSKTISKGAAT